MISMMMFDLVESDVAVEFIVAMICFIFYLISTYYVVVKDLSLISLWRHVLVDATYKFSYGGCYVVALMM